MNRTSSVFAEQPEFKAAYDAWWGYLTLKGDPDRRPYLIQEAFLAGVEAAIKMLNAAEIERLRK